ncbi:hypothetical protein [Legionella cincinnatiensis]|nr:hypothetical protein [Legionella cincinnatiensis]
MNQIISMKPEFKIERQTMRLLPVDHPENVYISPEKQALYLVHFDEKNDEFVDVEGDTLDGEYNFVLTCEESPKLLCDLNLNHSFLSNGKKVLGAGSLFFENGCLREITNNSGHYRPTDNEMLPFLKAMNAMSLGSVLSYKSYCTNLPKMFEMGDLLDINDFSEILSLDKSAELDRPTSNPKSSSGYDDKVVVKNEKDSSKGRRFGQNISKELLSQYLNILKNPIFAKKEDPVRETIQSQLNIKK